MATRKNQTRISINNVQYNAAQILEIKRSKTKDGDWSIEIGGENLIYREYLKLLCIKNHQGVNRKGLTYGTNIVFLSK